MANKNTIDALNKQMTDDLFTGMKSITKQSITYALLEKLIDMIMAETLKPGYTFPNENEMCKQLGIGRSTLRETYTALMAMGFITRTKAGTSVNDRMTIASAMPLRYIFKKSEINDVMDFRSMLESQTAYLAAQLANSSFIDELQSILNKMKKCAETNDIENLSKLDFDFHLTIALASGNPLLSKTLSAIASELERSAYSGYHLDPSIIEKSLEFHQNILDAIKAHDPSQAKLAMRTHIKDIYTVFRRISYYD